MRDKERKTTREKDRQRQKQRQAEIDGCKTPGIVSKSGSDKDERETQRQREEKDTYIDRLRQAVFVIGPQGRS